MNVVDFDLRSTMKQERLNNFMILHIYSEQTDAIMIMK